jgi:hypothetical protein
MSDDERNFKNLTTTNDIEALSDADAPCEWTLGPVLELERQIAAEHERQRGWNFRGDMARGAVVYCPRKAAP